MTPIARIKTCGTSFAAVSCTILQIFTCSLLHCTVVQETATGYPRFGQVLKHISMLQQMVLLSLLAETYLYAIFRLFRLGTIWHTFT